MMGRMTRTLAAHPPRPAAALAWALALSLLLPALGTTARAQELHRLLPAGTALALGLHDLDAAAPLLAAFVDPWVDGGVGAALAEVLGGLDAAALAGGLPVAPLDGGLPIPPELADLDPLALLGQEAWLGVSVSPFNPLPAVTLLARIDGETAARFRTLFDRERAAGALDLAEGALRFLQVDAGGFPIAAALDGELLALSSNPDVLRGVLRLRQGGSEPSFGNDPGVAATLGALGAGEFVGFLDLGPLARALVPFGRGLGFDVSLDRLVALLSTLGPVAGVTRLTPDGTLTTALRRLDPAGGDAGLLRLLDASAPAPRELLAWVPDGALAVQVTSLDLNAWWTYVSALVADLRELGVPDLNRTLGDVLGIDVQRDLVGWAAAGMIVVQTGAGELAPIGAAADDLLGETAFGLRTDDAAAAAAGLARLVDELGRRVALFADPFAAPGATANVVVREREVAGVAVRAYDLLPGLTIATAVADGVAWIATSEAGLEGVLVAGRSGAPLPAPFAALAAEVPAAASAFALSDDRASVAATGAALAQQVQLLAGFAGGGVDFEAVERATAALETYLAAIAPRFDGTVSWSTRDAQGRLRSDERSAIDLR